MNDDIPDISGKCGSCTYADMGEDGRAFCRRYPAQLLVHGGIQALFPVVQLTVDWCGEHKDSGFRVEKPLKEDALEATIN